MQSLTAWPSTSTPSCWVPVPLATYPVVVDAEMTTPKQEYTKKRPRRSRQKILRCLDMWVLDGDLVVPTCLQTPTLILPIGRFMQLYYNPDRQGLYASQFPEGGRGPLQPREDI